MKVLLSNINFILKIARERILAKMGTEWFMIHRSLSYIARQTVTEGASLL